MTKADEKICLERVSVITSLLLQNFVSEIIKSNLWYIYEQPTVDFVFLTTVNRWQCVELRQFQGLLKTKWATCVTSFRLAGNWREALYCFTLIFTIKTFRIFTLVEITSYVSHNGGSLWLTVLCSYNLQTKISLLVCTLNITNDLSFQTKNDPCSCKRNICNYLRSLKNYCSFKYFPVFDWLKSPG